MADSVPAHSSNESDRPGRRRATRRRVTGGCCFVAVALTATACRPLGLGEEQVDPEPAPLQTAEVEWVIDGDTVDVIIDGAEERVRLIGIDAPESKSRTDPVQCFGQESSDALTGLLPPGTEIRVERDAEARDRFGRLLLYIHRASDDLFINRYLVESGFADAKFFEPNTTYETDFIRARNDARSAGIGLWGVCDGPDQPLG